MRRLGRNVPARSIPIARPTPRFRLDIARLPYAARLGVVGVSYFGVAKLGLSFAASHQVVSAVWPPSGVAMAAVLILGYRIAPAIALGAFAANFTAGTTALEAVGIGAGNALGAVSARYLLTRAGLDIGLTRMRDVAALAVLGAAASTAVNASIGVGTLWAGGVVSPEDLREFWRTWWLGDLTGVLLVAPPLLLLLRGRRPRLPHGPQIAEASALAALLVLVTTLVLHANITLAYPVFPLVILAAMRFRQVGAVIASLVVAGLAVAYTWSGAGPFVGGAAADGLLRAQLFVGLAALTGLLVAAMQSEWEQAEEALARVGESEAALAEAQAIANVGSWEWDIENDEINWSDELYRIFGLDRETFGASYESYLKAIHPEDRELVDSEVTTAFQRGTPFEFEHRLVRPTGEVRNVASHGKVVCDSTGRPVRMRGTAQDVTERRLAEKRFAALLEAAPDAMIVVDGAHRIVDVNSRLLELFGYAGDELIGVPIARLFAEQPTASGGARPGDGRLRPAAATSELLAVRKDGVEVPVEVSLSPLRAGDRLLIAGSIRDVTERKAAERELEHQALHDPLTGLPNRGLFLDRLEHALTRARRPKSKLAVYFCDIDDFKLVNDSLGHGVGDELLIALPPRLREALRSADTVARFGGDEFVILCEELESEEAAVHIAERIAAAFAAPFEIGERVHYLSVSVGLVFVEAGRATATEVLRDADAAMYRAKGAGKGGFEIFDANMRAKLVRRLQTEAGLRRAVGEDELTLRFQPVLSLDGDEIVGAEALVRWDHPERGVLPPSEFIGVAEESGLIVPVGAWVLNAACQEAAAWSSNGGSKELGISINLSPRQVSDSNVIAMIEETIARTHIDPQRIDLEITENVLLAEGDAVGTLRRLKELGPRLVLDDFGTGYSSLSYLKRFPIDALKIDRVFIDGLVEEPEATAIVAAMLSMADALNVDVVAEGVETRQQLEWLRERGCAFAQGYLFAPPLEAAEIEEIVARPVAGAAR